MFSISETLIYMPSIIGILLIGLFVSLRSRQTVFRLYSIVTSLLGVWLLFEYFTDSQLGAGKLWLQLAVAVSTVIVGAFILFCNAYPSSTPVPKQLKIIVVGLLVVGIPLSFTPVIVKSVTYTPNGVKFISGPLYGADTIVLAGYILGGLAILIRRLRHADSAAKSQIYFLVVGTGVALLGSLVSGLVTSHSYWQAFRPFSMLCMVAIVMYAMIYRRLFDIRVYAIRAVAYVLTFLVATGAYVASASAVTSLVLHKTFSPGTVIYLAFITGLIVLLFQPLQKLFNRFTNRLFFRDYYEPQDVLDKISGSLVGTIDVDSMQKHITHILEDNLRPSEVHFVLRVRKIDYSLFAAADVQNVPILTTDDPILAKFTALKAYMQKENVELLARLRTPHEDLGYLVLGPRKSGASYTQSDKRVLGIIADELAIGLQNALRFQEIQKFNITLQQKIDDATRKLRDTNQRLRTLDETKDEFISMASHQLRTPLTSVKGYLSMVLEGDAGKLNKQQRELLTQSFISSQRMVYLIADLLNLSRLNTGRFVIETTPVDLTEVVQGEIDQLQETAKSRGLSLVYDKPALFPALMLDETKIHQVVMNFIDNAIYYTPSGGTITIELRETPTAVEYLVHDNGIGVPKAEQHRLFTKFYRAGNARKARPDGTGLGLFMAKKVIVAQEGSVIFQSEEGQGSTFGFRFNKAHHLAPTGELAQAAKVSAKAKS